MKRSTLAFAGMAAIALALPLTAQAGPGKHGMGGKHGAHFAKMDTDGDGNVTRGEAEAVLAGRFAEIDTNSDTFVSRDEMKAHHEAKRAEMKANWEARKAEAGTEGKRQRGEGMRKRAMDPAKAEDWKAKRAEKADDRWAAMDADGDGQLSLAEFTAAHLKAFEKADADSDGVVTTAEIEAVKAKKKERRAEWRAKKKNGTAE